MRGLADDDKPPLLNRRVSPGIKIVAIVIVSITLMMVDNAHDSLAPVRGSLAVAMLPLQMAAEMPGDVVDYLDRYFNRGQLIDRNDALSNKVLLLQARLQKLAALEAENDRIRALLDSSASIDQEVLIAEILSVSPSPYRHYVKLNKGSADGVREGQALVDANGILGQVTQVTPLGSRAILITDANHGIPVEINRTGLQTIAQGTGKPDALRLPFLASNADVKPGDLLVSSGLGGVYPAGYPVATVMQISHEAGNEFLDATATPTAHLNRGREALLVWTPEIQAPPATPDAQVDAPASDSAPDGNAARSAPTSNNDTGQTPSP